MCIMSFLPPQVKADEDGLYNGGMNNPDGHGWAVVAGDEIIVGKSLSLTKALDEFIVVRNKHLDGPALFHSRWATHGGIRVDNVHPFEVAGSAKTVVAHNGILREAAWPGKKDKRSDSRIFADDIMHKQFRRLDRPGVRTALTQWCGKGNKLVILTVDPRYRENAYLINESRGEWDKATGIWHSNTDYLWYTASKYRWSAQDWEAWPTKIGKSGGARSTADANVSVKTSEDEDRCWCCEVGHVDQRNFCDNCFSCQDCSEHINECMCWCEDVHEKAMVEEWERHEAVIVP